MKVTLLTLAAALSACSSTTAPARHQSSDLPLAPAMTMPATELSPSIYELPIELVDSRSRVIGLDVARGKPVLVTMFYASCSVACPLIISEVDQVIEELPADARGDVQVLLVSFDAERDTPEKLGSLARERKLDDARWTLATANDADARALAAVLGIKYRKLANGEFAHGSTIVVLDAEGHPVARTDSLGQRAPLLAGLTAR
jgi:protein SCO1/2